MPSPRVVFGLALAVFATGFVLGATAGPNPQYALAGSAAAMDPIVIVWPPVAPPAAPLAAPAPQPAPADETPATEPPNLPEAPAVAVTEAPAEPAPAATETEPAPADTETETEPEPEPTSTEPAPTLPPVKHVWLIVLTGHGLQDGFGPDSQSQLLRGTMPPKGLLLLDHHSVAADPLTNGLALITGGAPTGSLPEQLTGGGYTWKGYIEDAPGCQLPAPRNPFANVPALAGDCAIKVVGLDQLTTDLATAEVTPNFSYVVPNACHDGSDVPCAEGALAGMAAADGWLRTTLRQIRAAPAYKQDGLVIITFDHGADGKVGALLLSHFLEPTKTIDTRTDHYSLLKTIEQLFGLGLIGRAADDAVPALTAEQLAKPENG